MLKIYANPITYLYSLGCLELLFQVNGEWSSGMVSTRVSSLRRGELVYQSLAVDLPSGELEEYYSRELAPDKVVFKGYTRPETNT